MLCIDKQVSKSSKIIRSNKKIEKWNEIESVFSHFECFRNMYLCHNVVGQSFYHGNERELEDLVETEACLAHVRSFIQLFSRDKKIDHDESFAKLNNEESNARTFVFIMSDCDARSVT